MGFVGCEGLVACDRWLDVQLQLHHMTTHFSWFWKLLGILIDPSLPLFATLSKLVHGGLEGCKDCCGALVMVRLGR